MKQDDVIKTMYEIDDEEVIDRLYKFQRYIKIKTNKSWPILYVLDILYERLNEKDMKEFIGEYLGRETICSFSKSLKILLDLKNNEELIEILSDYCQPKVYKK